MSYQFRDQLRKFCENKPGLVFYVGPDGPLDKLMIIDSTLNEVIKKTLTFEMQDFMRAQFDRLFDEGIDHWRELHAINLKATETEQTSEPDIDPAIAAGAGTKP